jgi:hypothetical protein
MLWNITKNKDDEKALVLSYELNWFKVKVNSIS